MAGLIAISTGGTGGHVFPAEALAGELARRGHRLALITDRRGDAFGGTLDVIDRHTISAAGVSGRSTLERIGAAVTLSVGFFQARRLLQELKPAAVVGFGGYPTVPTMLAAGRLHAVRTAIHEQNAVLGRANRLLAPRMDRIATAFEETEGLRDADRPKSVRTGNPVRPEIAALAGRPYPTPGASDRLDLLVFGGSQGARIFGEVVPRAVERLPAGLRARLSVVQQARSGQVEEVRAIYRRLAVAADIRPFFDDMPTRLAAAHLLVCRAGASTVAELTTVGRPAILIPYQYAIDDHQTANAARLCDAAGAWMIPEDDLGPDRLAARLAELLGQPHTLMKAAQAAARIGMPEATRRLADLVVGLIDDNGDGVEAGEARQGAAA